VVTDCATLRPDNLYREQAPSLFGNRCRTTHRLAIPSSGRGTVADYENVDLTWNVEICVHARTTYAMDFRPDQTAASETRRPANHSAMRVRMISQLTKA
jgi:hypothetical protein